MRVSDFLTESITMGQFQSMSHNTPVRIVITPVSGPSDAVRINAFYLGKAGRKNLHFEIDGKHFITKDADKLTYEKGNKHDKQKLPDARLLRLFFEPAQQNFHEDELAPNSAVVIVQMNNKTISGTVVRLTPSTVILKTMLGTTQIPLNRIKTVVTKGERGYDVLKKKWEEITADARRMGDNLNRAVSYLNLEEE